MAEEAKEGWEYARLWSSSKFRSKGRKMDLVRRRLWLRKMVASNPDAEPVFTFTEDVHASDEDLTSKIGGAQQKAGTIPPFYSPRMYITYRGNCTVLTTLVKEGFPL